MLLEILSLPSWALWLVLIGACMLCLELGHALGQRLRTGYSASALEQLGGLQAGVLATLGILIAFVLSIVLSHFDQRRELIVQEANAIGTAYLRAETLPAEEGAEARQILRRYAQIRVHMQEHRSIAESEVARRDAKEIKVLQDRLWQVAKRSTQKDPRPLMNMFVAVVNEIIDLDTSRVAAVRGHVPNLVLFVFLLFVLLTMASIAFVSTARCGHRLGMWYFLATMLSGLLLVIVDLDRPRVGLIPINHEAMYYQIESMR